MECRKGSALREWIKKGSELEGRDQVAKGRGNGLGDS